ncbi:MAG: hypothetical protein AAGJ31_01780, partial [Verrucomicrobiota bacterium]
MMPRTFPAFLPLTLLFWGFSDAGFAEPLTEEKARQALQKAVGFFRHQVGHEGAYVYRYSADLTKQEGEGRAHRT